jgi:adenine-specific DNA-methyltransferase
MADGNSTELPTGLYWKGKKTEVERIALPFQTIEIINESRATREKEKGTFLRTTPDTSWYNRLIWGDNKYVMASLLEQFDGKINLIYIDPPFATGADFSVKMEIGDVEWTKEPSAMEDKAYRDTWGKGLDSYLQMMYERLVIMRGLLSEKGTIYIHLDWHVGHYIKVLMDEIFGKDNFRNEIVWCYTGPSKPRLDFPDKHELILRYTKSEDRILNIDSIRIPYSESFLNRRKYSEGSGGIMSGRDYDETKDQEEYKRGKLPEDWWSDIPTGGQMSRNEILNYQTQKPEKLLDRIVKASSNENDLVADFFCGSGTTGAVAEKLSRRWIMADLSRYAIHTTRKRLLGIDQCKPFVVQNLGKYERQYWQGVTFKKRTNEQIPIYEYIQFILNLYNAEPISGMMHVHGKKGRRLVHVGAVDAPVTLSEIKDAISEVKKAGQGSLDILGWDWEMGLHDVVEKEAKTEGVHLRLFNIPRDVMDPRAVEKGDITFYELDYLEVETTYDKHNNQFLVALKDFAIPSLDLVPPEVRDKIKKWSDYIDYWAVDWDWNEDMFHNMWQSYRTRQDRTLRLKTDGHVYENKGAHLVMVKVIDIFGNDTSRLVEVKC